MTQNYRLRAKFVRLEPHSWPTSSFIWEEINKPHPNMGPKWNEKSVIISDQHFGDLYCVSRRAFAYIVGNHPEIETTVMTDIISDPTNQHSVFADCLCHLSGKFFAVKNLNTLRFFEKISNLLGINRGASFYVQGFGMAIKHWHSNTSWVDPDPVSYTHLTLPTIA